MVLYGDDGADEAARDDHARDGAGGRDARSPNVTRQDARGRCGEPPRTIRSLLDGIYTDARIRVADRLMCCLHYSVCGNRTSSEWSQRGSRRCWRWLRTRHYSRLSCARAAYWRSCAAGSRTRRCAACCSSSSPSGSGTSCARAASRSSQPSCSSADSRRCRRSTLQHRGHRRLHARCSGAKHVIHSFVRSSVS